MTISKTQKVPPSLQKLVAIWSRLCGVVKDIIYDKDTDPLRFIIPTSITVEFESYTGSPFFLGEGREKWIPLRPQKQYIDRIKQAFRRQFPICLAYAITGHKSQGTNITGKLVVEIGDREPTPGYVNVVLSLDSLS